MYYYGNILIFLYCSSISHYFWTLPTTGVSVRLRQATGFPLNSALLSKSLKSGQVRALSSCPASLITIDSSLFSWCWYVPAVAGFGRVQRVTRAGVTAELLPPQALACLLEQLQSKRWAALVPSTIVLRPLRNGAWHGRVCGRGGKSAAGMATGDLGSSWVPHYVPVDWVPQPTWLDQGAGRGAQVVINNPIRQIHDISNFIWLPVGMTVACPDLSAH